VLKFEIDCIATVWGTYKDRDYIMLLYIMKASTEWIRAAILEEVVISRSNMGL
jgi:hypothetical protein